MGFLIPSDLVVDSTMKDTLNPAYRPYNTSRIIYLHFVPLLVLINSNCLSEGILTSTSTVMSVNHKSLKRETILTMND